eukprot:COSAG04_NODE_32292_length_252_cov_0.562092_1_plen_38_part_01
MGEKWGKMGKTWVKTVTTLPMFGGLGANAAAMRIAMG